MPEVVYDDAETANESGDELLQLVDAAIELLKQFPEMAPFFARPFRRLVIKNGIHGLFYTIESRGIVLHAFADLRRDPAGSAEAVAENRWPLAA
jgi:hypothetical protein